MAKPLKTPSPNNKTTFLAEGKMPPPSSFKDNKNTVAVDPKKTKEITQPLERPVDFPAMGHKENPAATKQSNINIFIFISIPPILFC